MGEDDVAHGAVKLRPSSAFRSKSKVAPQLIPFIGDAGQQEASEIVRIIERAKDKSKVADSGQKQSAYRSHSSRSSQGGNTIRSGRDR